MKSTLIFFALLGSICCHAQEWTKEYYDSSGDLCEPAASEYYILSKEHWDNPYDTMKSFYTAGDMLRSVSVVNEKGRRDGVSIGYHKNGVIKYKANYADGVIDGDVTNYYPDGRMQSVERFDEFRKSVMINYWDSLGNQLVKDGTGYCRCAFRILFDYARMEVGRLVDSKRDSVWLGFYESGEKWYVETYSEGTLISGTSIDGEGMTYEYTVLEESSEFPGGYTSLYQHVGKELVGKYPKAARKRGVEGKVFVEFVVNKDGSVSDVKAIKGIGAGCDEVAVAAVQSLPKWKPGRQRGRPVRQKFVLPLTFKLG